MRPFQTCFGHPSGRRRLRGWVIAFFLCVVLGGGLGPAPAQAVPIAGDYVFVHDNPNIISGSFTSTGSALSEWSFSSDLFARSFDGPVPYPILSWNSATDPVSDHFGINSNTAALFVTNNSTDITDPENGYYAALNWNPNSSLLNAVLEVEATNHGRPNFIPPPTVSFAATSGGPTQGAPEPSTLLLLGSGLLGLAAWRWKHAA